MKKIPFITVLLFFVLTGLIIALDDVQSRLFKIQGSGEMAPGESRDFTEYIYALYDAYSVTLIGVEGADASFVDVTLNSWSQITNTITADITISLDSNAPMGSTLSFSIIYRYYFIGGSARVESAWTLKVKTKNDGSDTFGDQQIITTAANGARSVFASDLDGDFDSDVLSASFDDNKIAWYENDGTGNFGEQKIISTAASGAMCVYASDLDQDGDLDVLSASWWDDKIAWYKNDGTGSFGDQQIITTSTYRSVSVYAADLDGDDDQDVLSASLFDNKIAWYENDSTGNFGEQRIISTAASGAMCVYASDLDQDGDLDVLSASLFDDKIAWYENDGTGNFGEQQIISTAANGAACVYASDLDQDGDLDVLSASGFDDMIAWYKNTGSGSFGDQQIITTLATGAACVYASDLDRDGDLDVLSASGDDDKIAWYSNDGSGSFGAQLIISTSAYDAEWVYAADLDGDGDEDVISASGDGDKIAWYENLIKKIEVTFNVKVPNSTPSNDIIYISGTFNFWDPGHGQTGTDDNNHDIPITNVGNNNHQITLSFDIGDYIEYKYTRGSWETVEKGRNNEEIFNRILVVPDSHFTQHDTVASWADIPVTVPQDPIDNIPKKYLLFQNYPNPFNPKTVISWQLAVSSDVELDVYNLLGEKVTTLVSKKMPAGYHEIEFNGQNLSSGVYLYRIEAGSWQDVKKMVYIR